MDRALRHGPGLVLYQLKLEPAQLLIKAMNAGTVEPVGIETHQILLMVNTNPPRRAAFCRASKCPIDKSSKQQAIDETVPHCDIEEARASSHKVGHKNFFWPTISTRRDA